MIGYGRCHDGCVDSVRTICKCRSEVFEMGNIREAACGWIDSCHHGEGPGRGRDADMAPTLLSEANHDEIQWSAMPRSIPWRLHAARAFDLPGSEHEKRRCDIEPP